jgi:hypothetical protein
MDPIYFLIELPLIGLISLAPLFYFSDDIFQILLDLSLFFMDIFFFQPSTLDDYILRTKPLWIKFKTRRDKLGWYEEYVLSRDLVNYIEMGGDMEYFISGPGSPLSSLPISFF